MNELRTQSFRLNSKIVFDSVDGQLAILNTKHGRFFYYSLETEAFLNLFKTSRSLDSLVRAGLLPSEEAKFVEAVVDQMYRAEILVEGESEAASSIPAYEYVRPQFLKEGQKKLEDFVHFMAPTFTGH